MLMTNPTFLGASLGAAAGVYSGVKASKGKTLGEKAGRASERAIYGTVLGGALGFTASRGGSYKAAGAGLEWYAGRQARLYESMGALRYGGAKFGLATLAGGVIGGSIGGKTGAAIGAGVGLTASIAMRGMSRYKALGKMGPKLALPALAALAVAGFVGTKAMQTADPDARGVGIRNDQMGYDTEDESGLRRRMNLMQASGDLVMGLYNKRHG